MVFPSPSRQHQSSQLLRTVRAPRRSRCPWMGAFPRRPGRSPGISHLPQQGSRWMATLGIHRASGYERLTDILAALNDDNPTCWWSSPPYVDLFTVVTSTGPLVQRCASEIGASFSRSGVKRAAPTGTKPGGCVTTASAMEHAAHLRAATGTAWTNANMTSRHAPAH